MGCGRIARVHPMEVPASCCPHDLHHVPRRGDGGHHGPPPPLGPWGEDPEGTTVVEWPDRAEE